MYHLGFEIGGSFDGQIAASADRGIADTTGNTVADGRRLFVAHRPVNGTCHIVELHAASTLHYGQHHLDVTIVLAFSSEDDINRLGSTLHGVTDGLVAGVVFLTVDGQVGQGVEGLYAHHGSLGRRNGNDGVCIYLAPIVPAGVIELTRGSVDFSSHVDGLTADGCLCHPHHIALILPLHIGSTVFLLEVELHGDRLRAVGKVHLVGGEHSGQRGVGRRNSVFSAGSILVHAVAPCGQRLALHIESAVSGQRHLSTHLFLNGCRHHASSFASSEGNGTLSNLSRQVGRVNSRHTNKRTVAVVLYGQRSSRQTAIVGGYHILIGIAGIPAFLCSVGLDFGDTTFTVGNRTLLVAKLTVTQFDEHRSLNRNSEHTVHPTMLSIVEAGSLHGEVGRSIVGGRCTISAVGSHYHAKVIHIGGEDGAIRQLHSEVAERSIGRHRAGIRHSTEQGEQAQ